MSESKQYERVGRSTKFTKDISSQDDIVDLADRVAQPVGIGSRRDELDAVSVAIKERSGSNDRLQTTFQSIIDGEDDVEAVTQRLVNVLFMGFRRGAVDDVEVNIVELQEVDSLEDRTDHHEGGDNV